jgi:hypothetical protein
MTTVLPTTICHLDRSETVSSSRAVERPLYFVFALAFAFLSVIPEGNLLLGVAP